MRRTKIVDGREISVKGFEEGVHEGTWTEEEFLETRHKTAKACLERADRVIQDELNHCDLLPDEMAADQRSFLAGIREGTRHSLLGLIRKGY